MKRLVLIEDGVETDVRCDRCAHWGEPALDRAEADDNGRFATLHRDCRRLQKKPRFVPLEDWEAEAAALLVDDHDETFSELFTLPPFGCALFEPKEEACQPAT